jgi:hypothetical protein
VVSPPVPAEAVTVSVEPAEDRPAARMPWPLVLVLVPLLLILCLYVVDAIQVSLKPLPPRNADIALAPITRPDVSAVALSAYTLAASQPPSRRVGDYVFSQTEALMDISPEASFLKAAGRKIQRAGVTGDAQAWAAAVLDLCRLSAGSC